jgi:hypothetical protein
MPKTTLSIENDFLNYKNVNHIIHYLPKLEYIIDIIKKNEIHPSYCKEEFNGENILIPMICFCNIPIIDVNHFMYYGNYGLGFSIDWAIKNNISPVIYAHENSDFLNLPNQIDASAKKVNNHIKLINLLNRLSMYENHLYKGINDENIKNHINSLLKTNKRFIQFTKMWKNEVEFEIDITYNNISVVNNKIDNKKTINSYNEKEWRFVPNFKDNDCYKDIIFQKESEYLQYTDKDLNPKPHIIEDSYSLKFKLEDLRYIIVNDSSEVHKINEELNNTFSENCVMNRIKEGKLLILPKQSLKNDF